MMLSRLVLPLIGLTHSGIDESIRAARLIVAVIALSALFVVRVVLVSLALWQREYEVEHPSWVTALLSIPALGAAGFLVWVVVTCSHEIACGANRFSDVMRAWGLAGKEFWSYWAVTLILTALTLVATPLN
jgi:hypothetical protein